MRAFVTAFGFCTFSAANAAPAGTLVPQDVQAIRTTGPIILDGRLDEGDWRNAAPLTRLWELFPANRVAAPEESEVRFLYDDRYLYVGFRLPLKDPARLRKPFVRRDKVGSTHDYVQVYLDPQASGQTSTLFRVNARGTQTDGVQDEAKQSESTDPDFDWEVRSAVDPRGWTSEMRIPLSTLRVSKRGAQMWNVIVTRGVPREQNTQMATAPFPRNGSCFLCYASKLAFPDLSPKDGALIVQPSATGTVRIDSRGSRSATHLDLAPGLDVKWLPYGGAALDLTVNPDFSQVEADSPQLTSNQRFSINLPEKRPFFREGSDLINTPLPILYTRTIVAPDYGLRWTQRSTSLNGTAFFARDAGRGPIIEPGLLSSRSATPDFDSHVGFAHLTDRIGSMLLGSLAAAKFNDDGSHNIIAGIDWAWQNSVDRLTAQLLGSWTRNPDRPNLVSSWTGQAVSGAAAFAEWDHRAELVWTLRYTRYDPGFRSWTGFVPRVGYDDVYVYLKKPNHLGSPLVNELSPYASLDALAGIGTKGGERDPALGVYVGGIHALSADLSWHPNAQVLTEQGQERRYGQVRWTMSIQPSLRIPVIGFNGSIGHDVDYSTGDVVPEVNLAVTLRTRPVDRLELEGRLTRLRLGAAPGGRARLRETIPEFLATLFFGPAFYALADLQLHRSRRDYPAASDLRTSLSSLQLVWEPALAWRAYFGVRSGSLDPGGAARSRRSTELYFKLSRRIVL